MKKIISFTLVLMFILSNIINITPLTSKAADYTTDYVLAINTSRSTTNENRIPVANLKSSSIFTQDESVNEGMYIKEPYATHIDETTGEVITQYSKRPNPNFQLPTPKSDFDNSKPKININQTTNYNVGDTKDFILDYSGTTVTESINIECKYIGTYCTVWVDKNTHPDIKLSDASIKQLADDFDANWPKEVELFGDYAEIARNNADSFGVHNGDADFDGKLAIICYDIENQYAANTPTTEGFTGGFFQGADNYIDINNKSKYSSPSNCMDCIHMDTYPSMGDKDHLVSQVEKNLSTLYHEAQHLIQQSYKTTLPTYLNEGFSMAAEHAISGDPISNSELYGQRVSNFNKIAVSGWPLTYWYSHVYAYAPAYVFTQYLRTQYAQTNAAKAKGDKYGNEFFRLVLERYKQAAGTSYNTSDSVYENVITNILGVDSYSTLIKNFWRACVQRSESGIYSFNNEPWSHLISPYAATPEELSKSSSFQGNIINGGAILFNAKKNMSISTSSSNIEFIPLNLATSSDYTIKNTTQNYTGAGKTLSVTPNSANAGSMTAICYYTEGTGYYSDEVDEVYLYIPSIEGYNSLPKKIGIYKAKLYSCGGTQLCSYSFDEIKQAYDSLLNDGQNYQSWNKRKIYSKLASTGIQLPNLTIKDNPDGNLYTITYVNYDNTETLYSETVSDISEIDMSKTAPERSGYVFLGWDGLPDTLSEDVTLIASYLKIPTSLVANEALSLDTNLSNVDIYYEYVDSLGNQTSTLPTTPGVYSVIVTIKRNNELIYSKTFENINLSPSTNYKNTLIYRLYNPNSGEHLFTSKEGEYNKLGNIGWVQEGKAFDAFDADNTPPGAIAVYRLFNPKGFDGKGDHHYTKSTGEITKLKNAGWTVDFNGSPAFYVLGDITVYKMYNKADGAHHYTPKEGEKNNMVKAGWIDEGVAWTVNGYYTSNGDRIGK